MSKCDEIGGQITETKSEISRLGKKLRALKLDALVDRREEIETTENQIKVQEQKLKSLQVRYNNSLKKGGC